MANRVSQAGALALVIAGAASGSWACPAGTVDMAALSEMFDTADAACAPADTLPAHDACQWTFDLRAPAALALYEGLVADLSACWEGLADTGVNHPDSYRAMTFEAPGARVVVSEKDKSVLDATLVTLRVYPASGG